MLASIFFFFQAEDGIRDIGVTGVQTCALPILKHRRGKSRQTIKRAESAGVSLDRIVAPPKMTLPDGGAGFDFGEACPPERGCCHWEGEICRGNYRSEERRVGKECRSRWWRSRE